MSEQDVKEKLTDHKSMSTSGMILRVIRASLLETEEVASAQSSFVVPTPTSWAVEDVEEEQRKPHRGSQNKDPGQQTESGKLELKKSIANYNYFLESAKQ